MTIKAVLRHGVMQPVEPISVDWKDGQELVVEPPPPDGDQAQINQWAQEMEASVAQLPAEEHDRFRRALDEIERESKEAVRG